MADKHVLIWDLPLRVFHWAFAANIVGCWATHELGSEFIDWHMRLGYLALSLIIFRLIWGIVGSTHSQFKHFITSPQAIVSYLKNGQRHTPGHNPMGSLMVIFMLFLGLVQASSGLFVDDEIFTTGPYFNALGEQIDNVMSAIHHNGFNVLATAVFVHVAAIVYYQVIKKQNLVKPMITGYKSAGDVAQHDAIDSSKVWLGLIVAVVCAVFVYWLVVVNASPPVDGFY